MRMAWLIAAVVFWLHSIYTQTAVSINCLRYLQRMLQTLLVLSHPDILIPKNCSFFLCILSLRWFIYDWITIMEFSKHEISTINMLYSLKKSAILHPYLLITVTFPQRLLSSFPKGAVVEMFDCNNAWTRTLFCQFLCYPCPTSTWKSLSYVIRRR